MNTTDLHGGRGRLPFVGRDAELEAIGLALREIRDHGKARTLHITGPRGCGKTRLLTEATDRARTEFTVAAVVQQDQRIREVLAQAMRGMHGLRGWKAAQGADWIERGSDLLAALGPIGNAAHRLGSGMAWWGRDRWRMVQRSIADAAKICAEAGKPLVLAIDEPDGRPFAERVGALAAVSHVYNARADGGFLLLTAGLPRWITRMRADVESAGAATTVLRRRTALALDPLDMRQCAAGFEEVGSALGFGAPIAKSVAKALADATQGFPELLEAARDALEDAVRRGGAVTETIALEAVAREQEQLYQRAIDWARRFGGERSVGTDDRGYAFISMLACLADPDGRIAGEDAKRASRAAETWPGAGTPMAAIVDEGLALWKGFPGGNEFAAEWRFLMPSLAQRLREREALALGEDDRSPGVAEVNHVIAEREAERQGGRGARYHEAMQRYARMAREGPKQHARFGGERIPLGERPNRA